MSNKITNELIRLRKKYPDTFFVAIGKDITIEDLFISIGWYKPREIVFYHKGLCSKCNKVMTKKYFDKHECVKD